MINLSITRLGTLYILAALVAGSVLLGLAAFVLGDARTVAGIWKTFEATRSEKALALTTIRREMGYGGMIHNFKNFVLRGDTDLLHIVEERIGGTQAAILQYRYQGINQLEQRALAQLESTLRQYANSLDMAREMNQHNANAVEIDRAVSVNDSPALNALDTLNTIAIAAARQSADAQKPLLLYELRAALGYGGMIHQFKNFVLRRNFMRLPGIAVTTDKVRGILERYRQVVHTAEETAALKAIADVAEAYATNLKTAADLASSGQLPSAIDNAVKIDDRPALEGLSTLTRAIIVEHQKATSELGKAINRIVNVVSNQVWAVAAVVLIMIFTTVWVLRFMIVNPLNALTNSMRELADGNLETAIPKAGKDTEIGHMAANMEVFKSNERDRRDAEKAIRERERWFQALLASAPDPTIIVDADGTIELVNFQTEAVFGYAAGEMIGQKIEMLVPEAVRGGHVAHRTSYVSSALTRPMGAGLELNGQRKSGEIFPVEVSLSPIETSKGLQVAAAVRDITKRKEAEEQLEQAFSVISGSIDYAANIQRSILPHRDSFSTFFSDHLVIWQPRDRVGGDVYWNRIWGDGILIILADCTGHGVPGAFMTLIATGALDRAQDEVTPGDIAKLLQRMHQLIQLTLGQHTGSGTSDDGLELGAVYIDGEQSNMTFAGARFSVFATDGTNTTETKGDKTGIGYRGVPYGVEFTTHTIPVGAEFSYYLASDGYTDQVGGEKARMFGKKRFKTELCAMHEKPMEEQARMLLDVLADYQGKQPRRDDVSIIGFKI